MDCSRDVVACVGDACASIIMKELCYYNYQRHTLGVHSIFYRLPGRSKTPKFFHLKHGYLCLCIRLSEHLQLPSCGDIETNPGPSLSGCNNSDAGMASQQRTSSTSIVNSLKCGLINTCSLQNKLTEFQLLLSANIPDIFAVTETWLSSNITDAEILSGLPYNCYRNDRCDGRRGGGVLLFVKNNCISIGRMELERNGC